MERCILCDGSSLKNKKTVIVKEGLRTIVLVSQHVKNDGLAKRICDLSQLEVHVACRNKYTHHIDLKNLANKENVTPIKRRSSEPLFDFERHCFICGQDANESTGSKLPLKLRRVIHCVRTDESKQSFVKRAIERNDDKGTIVHGRLNSVLDIKSAKCKYHADCQVDFFLHRTDFVTPKRGRPRDTKKDAAFETLCAELEKDDECQFSVSDLAKRLDEIAGEEVYDVRSLKDRLKSHYGSSGHVTSFPGKHSVFCFKGHADNFIYQKWAEERKPPEDMRCQVVKQAAKILREEIRSKAFDMESYFCGAEMNEEYLVPDLLRTFLTELIKHKSNQAQRTVEALAQAIMQACRPRSFISPILLAIGVYIHRHIGSRLVIDILHSLGYSASYGEVQIFLLSAATAGLPPQDANFGAFQQFVFDNADYNVRTIDGYNTLHNMGAIRATTPAASSSLPYSIPRLRQNKGVQELTSGRMKIVHYCKPATPGLKSVTAAMGGSTTAYDVSSLQVLPFINLDPGNLSCIFTALAFAVKQSRDLHQNSCVVTFDQPLFVKASEIAAAEKEKGTLKGLVVMLGSFHTAMSYMGAIGRIMSGSGLEELWETAYAANSVKQMVGGHAYSRAVRAHMLTHLSLGLEIMKRGEENVDHVSNEIERLHTDLFNNDTTPEDAAASDTAEYVFKIVKTSCERLAASNRTARLWISYFEMATTAMIPYFHAAGHLNYAKAAHLHMQNMEDLARTMDPADYELFTGRGYFVVRRSKRFWAGLALDLTIEQFLMRAIKSEGGLTRGRGITESVLAKWIDGIPHCIPICNALESFCSIRSCKSEQHVELRDSRMERDLVDLGKFAEWFETHPPFQERPHDQLVSLSTGLIADKTVNCDSALEIGIDCMKSMVDNNFCDVKLRRSKQVKPLSSMSTAVNARGDGSVINPMQLLNRIVCIQDRLETPLSDFLSYELAPQPLSLFDNGSLRKTSKCTLEKAIERVSPCIDSVPNASVYVVDGGYLLHVVPWPRPAKYYAEVCESYISYAKRKFPLSSTIVFDGYDGRLSTKSIEQRRRAAMKTSPNLNIALNKEVRTAKDNFLGNGHNKSNLIKLLSPMLREEGFRVFQAESDADTLIANTAVDLSERSTHVTVFASDTDVLTLLVALAPNDASISMTIPGNSGKPDRVHMIKEVQQRLGTAKEAILLVHAMTGCDTTSAFFGKGKKKLLDLAMAKPELSNKMKELYKTTATEDTVAAVGEEIIIALYGGKCQTLNELRPLLYKKTVGKQKLDDNFDFRSLPPTTDGAKYHSLRVYHQVQAWLGNDLPLDEWGWKTGENGVLPVTMKSEPAPPCLMKMVRCNCKKGCERGCECRRAGFACTEMCGVCSGVDCSNAAQFVEAVEAEEDTLDIDDPGAR
ncbi:hypothetical protein FOCC_FOCC009627 [Frankliniella occidentalis]|nr:hypothetical protein FOCC_FOCC009627 [Frankliniella occidentalis]